ncbi:hypothetical protein KI387_037802, partial [Taxus chinensis]
YYILNSHTKVLVPDTVVKSILTQQELGSLRGNWIAKVQEYDLDIKPTKLVRGRGLCQLMAENKDSEVPEEKDNCIDGMWGQPKKDDSLPMVLFVATSDEWYSDITFFLTY